MLLRLATKRRQEDAEDDHNGQPERDGSTNYDLYAAFNRTIDGSQIGSGVSQVVVTLYPSR